MTGMILTKMHLHDGKWEGVLSVPNGEAPPALQAFFDDRPVDGVSISETTTAGEWKVVVPVPVSAISDGIQTVLITNPDTGEVLNAFGLMAGEVPRDMVQAELALLRAELDMLKRAFRRHCSTTID